MIELNDFCKKSFEVAKARQDNGGKIADEGDKNDSIGSMRGMRSQI